MKTEDFSWCNDSGYSDVFNNSLCECTAPQVNDGMCICGKPINDNMTNTLKQNLELRKALAEVDRLTSENLDLKQQNHVWESEWQELYAENQHLKDDVNRLTKEQSINLDIIQTQKKRLRSNEIMLRSHEKDITALQNKLK